MLVLFASVLVIFRAWLVVSIASKANHVSDMYPRNRVQRWLVGCGKSTPAADLSGEMSNMSQAAREFVHRLALVQSIIHRFKYGQKIYFA